LPAATSLGAAGAVPSGAAAVTDDASEAVCPPPSVTVSVTVYVPTTL